jgi:L-2-hydroxycarboxylate dehydrogenase (NAD+)
MQNRAPGIANPQRLEHFVSTALQAAGVPLGDADLTANILIDADLRGIDSHGVMNLYGTYVKKLLAGAVNNKPNLRLAFGSLTTASLDGDNGLGFVASHKAMTACIEMAKQHGTGWATVYHSNHSGAGTFYVLMAARQNMIGIHWSTGGSTVAGPGGKRRLIGNNVFAIAAPGKQQGPFVLDMAATMAIANKIHMRQWEGKRLPEGWAVDSNGQPITDPARYFATEGAILPLGSTASNGVHKGFGLLLVTDILTGLLSGDGGSMLRRKGEESQAFCALRIDAFPTGGDFTGLMDAMIERIHAEPTVEGAGSMRYPGERGNLTYVERSVNGIPLRPNLVEDLRRMSAELGLSMDDIWET